MATAHCEWGLNGVHLLREHCAVLVIVDVLSFSTAVDVAVARGAEIVPFPLGDQDASARAAAAANALLASHRRAGEQLSLSPASLQAIAPGTRLMLPSPNGSCLSLERGTARTFAGCLRNRNAVARAAIAAANGGDIGVIPAGERWRGDGSLRPAIEDLLGAGAIMDALDLPLVPEARIARDAFRAARLTLGDTIRGCLSGRDLIEKGFLQDVELAVQLDVSVAAPILRRGAYCTY
ncbi:MAG: 2-phosphosulfolactate phosphatase [Alphaproteobacteria bacterium]|nr:2-phosphosulfolactate phosphatase [Alphaproteobacteria bacterium]MBL7098575.1 2-phosphosulfolactate phosphatase [Alphaproteobacteria bacterium]